MGNAPLSGTKPNPKDPSLGRCSTGIWSGDESDVTGAEVARSSAQKALQTKLQTENAYIDVPNFCAYEETWEGITAGQGVDDSLRRTVCDNLGDVSEWKTLNYAANTCYLNNCNVGYSVGESAACNGRCCAIVGAGVGCARIAFLGDPTVCCFNDYACSQNEEDCFQTPERQRTCGTSYRDVTTSVCRDQIEDYCIGNKLFPTQTDWIEMWLENSEIQINSEMQFSTDVYPATRFTPEVIVRERGFAYPGNKKQPCLSAIARNISNQKVCSWDQLQDGTIVTGNINPEGLAWSVGIINKVYDRYVAENGKGFLTGISQDGYNRDSSFYNSLWQICNKVPLLCTNGNEEFPSGILPKICSDVTVETLKENPDALKWCGCHMKPEQYEDYLTNFGIEKECTPMCNQDGILPAINTDGVRKFCEQNICAIDDNSISIASSKVSGAINFNQLCPGCGKSNVTRTFSSSNAQVTTSSTNNLVGYLLTNPYNTVFPTELYSSGYGKGYSASNFKNSSNSVYILQCFLTPSNITSDFITDEEVKKNNYPTAQVIFGTIYGTDVIGVVNAGFEIESTITYDTSFNRVVYSAEGTETNSVINYPKLVLEDGGEYASGLLFKKVTTEQYSDSVVSKYSNKFSIFGENSQVSLDTCTCVMDNLNLDSVNSIFRGSINFNQECGKSKCYNSSNQLVSCAGTNVNISTTEDTVQQIENQTILYQEEEKYTSIFFVILSIMIASLILYFILSGINRF